MDRSILKNRLLNNPQLLSKQINCIRNVAQVNLFALINHLNIQKNEDCLEPPIPINYLKKESGVKNFLAGLQEDSIKYGCIQSLDLLDSNSYQKASNAMTQKLSAHLPSSLLSNVRP